MTDGTTAPAWGDGVRLHVWLALARGNTLTLDVDPYDRLDSGNVAGASTGTAPVAATGLPGLWLDVSCDVLEVSTTQGATRADGVFARAEAGTARIVLADPGRRFDPVDPDPAFSYQGVSRLAPGLPVLIWAEVPQYDVFILRRTLFVGTVESIAEPWTPNASKRRCTIVAADATAQLVRRKRPELPEPVGEGETTSQRIARILEYYDGPTGLLDTSTTFMSGTTMGGSAWDEIQKTVDAEGGFAYVTPYPADPLSALFLSTLVGLRFLMRDTWDSGDVEPTVIPCRAVVGATVSASDEQKRTSVTAGNGTTTYTASVPSAVEMSYSKTDLPLLDSELPGWANFVLGAFVRTRAALTSVTMRPSNAPGTSTYPGAWADVTGIDLVAEPVIVEWLPPGELTAYAVTGRVIGVDHNLTRTRWEVTWALADVDILPIPLLQTESDDVITGEDDAALELEPVGTSS